MGSVYEEIVDALNAVHGKYPGFRAAHAKGVVCSGSFTATPEARELTSAEHLQGDPVDVTVRLSNGSGNPEARDGDRRDGRGLAVKFRPPGGPTDIVTVSIPVWFVRTRDDFLAFLRAREPDPETGEPDMEKLGAFLGEHPESQAAVGMILPALTPPPSYAHCAFNGLHAFGLTRDGGEPRWGRYRWEPDAGEKTLPDEEIDATSRDYLQEELVERLGREPLRFTLTFKLAEGDDPIDDPTQLWPDDREVVELGHLEVAEVAEDAEPDGGVLVFDPVNVIDGIVLSDDEILHARSKAYSVSVERRLAAKAEA
jgi:catalase